MLYDKLAPFPQTQICNLHKQILNDTRQQQRHSTNGMLSFRHPDIFSESRDDNKSAHWGYSRSFTLNCCVKENCDKGSVGPDLFQVNIKNWRRWDVIAFSETYKDVFVLMTKCFSKKQLISIFYTMHIFIQLFYSIGSNAWCFVQIFIFPQLFNTPVWRKNAVVVCELFRNLRLTSIAFVW